MSDRVAGVMILSENRALRMVSFFLLYVGQGLPLGISQVALPAWLVMNGANELAVGAAISAAFTPWSFKFIPAAFMDRFAYLPMGRRRAWLIGAQLLMVLGFAMAAIIGPGADDLETVLYVILLIGTGSAIQDVAVDGMAVDILPEEEQGTASAVMFGGQTIGRALAAVAAGYGLQYYGSSATFLFFLPIILLITLFVVFLRERPGEKRFPWSAGAASAITLERHVGAALPMLKAGFRSLIRWDSIKLLIGSALARCASAFFSTMFPILAVGTMGYTAASYSGMISMVDLAMAILAIGLGSWLTTRMGARGSSVLTWLTYAAFALFMLYGQPLWALSAIFILVSCIWSLHDTMTSICTNPLRMQLSDPAVAATQFTIYNSLSNLPVAIGASLFAVLGGTEAMPLVMWLAAGLMATGALIFATLKVGAQHVAAQPVPEIN